jgi:hypothetical protein
MASTNAQPTDFTNLGPNEALKLRDAEPGVSTAPFAALLLRPSARIRVSHAPERFHKGAIFR